MSHTKLPAFPKPFGFLYALPGESRMEFYWEPYAYGEKTVFTAQQMAEYGLAVRKEALEEVRRMLVAEFKGAQAANLPLLARLMQF